jgi:hypothetical protein
MILSALIASAIPGSMQRKDASVLFDSHNNNHSDNKTIKPKLMFVNKDRDKPKRSALNAQRFIHKQDIIKSCLKHESNRILNF